MNNNNVNNTANKLANTIRNIQGSNKTKIGFIIIIFIFLLIILILIIKRTINANRMRNRLLKNTFFIEMEKELEPYNSWCTEEETLLPDYITYIKDSLNTIYKKDCSETNNLYVNTINPVAKVELVKIDPPQILDENGTDITVDFSIPSTTIKNVDKCQDLCIYDKNGYTNIPNKITNLDNSNHYGMFWFRINKNSTSADYPFSPNNELSLEYPLIYFSDKDIIPNFNKCHSFGFYIKPINNILTVRKDGGDPLTSIYNLPYDKWVCLTYLKNSSSIDIYINGRLLKTIAIKTGDYNNIFTKPIRWGPYPGNLAFLEINKDPDDLNPLAILDSYKYYNSLIEKYEKNKFNDLTSDMKPGRFPFRNSTEWNNLLNRGKSNSNLVCY